MQPPRGPPARYAGFPAAFELASLDGHNGFAVLGIGAGESAGERTGLAGDVNDDGFDDLIIGAPFADANGQLHAGQAYVVFGRPPVGACCLGTCVENLSLIHISEPTRLQ